MTNAPKSDRGIFGTSTYWRASMTMPRFIIFDARLVTALALVIFHLRLWTFIVLVCTAIILWGVEYYGYRLPNAIRRLRALTAGKYRPAKPGRYYRTARDLAFEDHPLTAHTMFPRRRALARAQRQSAALKSKVTPSSAPKTKPRRKAAASDGALVGTPA